MSAYKNITLNYKSIWKDLLLYHSGVAGVLYADGQVGWVAERLQASFYRLSFIDHKQYIYWFSNMQSNNINMLL